MFSPGIFGRLCAFSTMPDYRMTMPWSNFPGAPGYTNFHFRLIGDITTELKDETMTKVRAFFQSWASFLPSGVTISMPSQFEEIDLATGELTGVESVTPAADVVGSASSAPYSPAVGACVTWDTQGFINGRRIRGRTFMVPLAPTSSFQSDGTLAVAGLTTMRAAAATLANATTGIALGVWHRPSPGGSDGTWSLVTGSNVIDKTAVLRSRRD